jgi:integrase
VTASAALTTSPTISPPTPTSAGSVLDRVAADYIAAGPSRAARTGRRLGVAGFRARFRDLAGWAEASVADRRGVRTEVASFAGYALLITRTAVDAEFVVASGCRWGHYLAAVHPGQYQDFRSQTTDLGFCGKETERMWAHLARICLIAGATPASLTAQDYTQARSRFVEAMVAARPGPGGVPRRSLSTPLFGLDAVMFHRGQAGEPARRRPWAHGPVSEVDWDQITAAAPHLAATMRRYLDQTALSLRPSSVTLFDTTLRQFAGLLLRDFPTVATVAGIDREHIEAYKTWLAARPGYRKNTTLTKTTLGMRVGHLRTFFTRITEWGYHDVPARIPVYSTDRPRLDKPLPKFLDDAQAAAFMTAARNLPEALDRLMLEILARTGMRRGELLGLRIDAVVQIGTGYWLRTPVGKLHTDRYIPLHPQLKTLIDDWLTQRPGWQASDLLLLDRGRPIPPTRVDRAVQKAAAAAGLGHVHPHQLRHTLATQAINRGMSLEAIAALLGHHDLSMTMVYARIGDRTVADEYFAVTRKVENLYATSNPTTGPATGPVVLPAGTAGPAMRHLRAEATKRLLGNGYCTRPLELDCRYETICESCTMFFTTIEHRPTIQAQRDDAHAKGQTRRQEVYDTLLARLDDLPA